MNAAADLKRPAPARVLRPLAPTLVTDAVPKPRLTGTLVALFERGYGFISPGKGKPSYFVRSAQVSPEHWVKGQRFSFTSAPPKAGTTAPRAENPIAIEDEP